MLRVASGLTEVTDSHAEMSFRETDGWPFIEAPELAVAMKVEPVFIGDENKGPVVMFTHMEPGRDSEPGPAHAHASDNFRISLLGELTMGRDRYGPGDFRFQHGWKAYPSDNNSCGPDGGWEMVLMADRRGLRIRAVQDEFDEIVRGFEQSVAAKIGLGGDIFSDDPANTAGPSGLVMSLGPATNSGKLNGSFDDCDRWTRVGDGSHAAAALMGDPNLGPIVVLASHEPGAIASPGCTFGTEVFRLVVDGSCMVGARSYECGDMRIEFAGQPSPPVVAGEGGLQEVLVIGDRRQGEPITDGGVWPFADLVAELRTSGRGR